MVFLADQVVFLADQVVLDHRVGSDLRLTFPHLLPKRIELRWRRHQTVQMQPAAMAPDNLASVRAVQDLALVVPVVRHGPGVRPGFGSGGPGVGPGGPGMGEGAVTLDPLVGLDDARKPLRSKVLAVPSLCERYLRCVRSIAETSLDWKNLGPVVAEARSLIQEEVAADTRKLSTLEAFLAATAESSVAAHDDRAVSLQDFARQRRTFLLEHPEIAKLPRESSTDSRPAVKTTSIRPADTIRHVVMEVANPPVVISEFLAAAQRPHNEQSSESEDWIELFNRSEQEVDLSGAYLSDDRDNLTKWSFPAGTTIPSRGFLIVWADENGRGDCGLARQLQAVQRG